MNTSMKTCSKCSIEKPLTEFSRRKNSKDGYQGECKVCSYGRIKIYSKTKEWQDYQKQWKLNNPDKLKNNQLKRKFGITLEDYNLRLFNQKGCCAICNTHHTIIHEKTGKSLHVDHCHTTGKVRGLLCYQCNAGLGYFRDNTNYLQSAINYLV